MTIGIYHEIEKNMVHQAQKKNDKDHRQGVGPNIHYDQISGFDNLRVEKMPQAKINVNSYNKR